jgi:hypothetical protein
VDERFPLDPGFDVNLRIGVLLKKLPGLVNMCLDVDLILLNNEHRTNG